MEYLKIAARKIKSIDSLNNLLTTVSNEDRVKIAEIIILFRNIDEKRNDYIPENFNDEVWNTIIKNFRHINRTSRAN